MLRKIVLATAGLAIAATTAFAAGEPGPYDGAIKARQAHMQLNAHNLGILGAMAQGKTEYDADAAKAAADNLAALANFDQGSYWPQGSDSTTNEGTRALPEIWTGYPDILSKVDALAAASTTMQTAAGESLEDLQGAMGGVGGACGACHKAYRQSN
ncbi:MAG: cytochrome c [Paracoccaceae bacterium]